MSNKWPSLGTLARLGRVSNLPTCASNVLVGAAIGALAVGTIDTGYLLLAIASAFLLYIGGIALNDVIDAPIDAIERSNRPIPTNQISRRLALVFALITMSAGLAVAAAISVSSLLIAVSIVICIVLYDFLHKRFIWAAVLMGLCRGGLYVLGASCVAWPAPQDALLILSAAITIYVSGLTVLARYEVRGPKQWHAYAGLLLPIPCLAPIYFFTERLELWTFITGILLILWILRASAYLFPPHRRIGKAVLGWIGALSLIDAFYLSILGQPSLVLIAGACFLWTLTGHRYISGT